jgi:hypothetical protein
MSDVFTVTETSPEPVELVWQRVSDLVGHSAGVPLTSTTSDPGEPAVGWRFTPRTGLGPVGFDDPMVVTVWEPPRRLRVEKVGRVLAGWADISLAPLPEGGTRVTWQEEVLPAHTGIGRRMRPLFDAVGKVVFRRALTRMLRGGG